MTEPDYFPDKETIDAGAMAYVMTVLSLAVMLILAMLLVGVIKAVQIVERALRR